MSMSVSEDAAGDGLPEVGRKFEPDGRVRHFPGNTILFRILPESRLGAVMGRAARRLAGSAWQAAFSVLPPASYHMTLFSGANDQMRSLPEWPADLAADASLATCHHLFARKLERFDLECALPVSMRLTGIGFRHGFLFRLAPIDDRETAKLARLRDRLSSALCCARQGHADYEFHATIAYQIRLLPHADSAALQALLDGLLPRLAHNIGIVRLELPEFCTFEDMAAFRPILSLRNLAGDGR